MLLILKRLNNGELVTDKNVKDVRGFLWGEGHAVYSPKDSVWIVVKAADKSVKKIDDLEANVFCSIGEIVFSGDLRAAARYLLQNGADGKVVIGAEIKKHKAGSIVVTGDLGFSYSNGVAISGDYGLAETGDNGHSIVGFGGIAKTGSGGIAVAKRANSTAIAGYKGQAIVSLYGKASAGHKGIITIEEYVSCVGDNGIMPHVLYQLNRNEEPIPAIESIKKYGIAKFWNETFLNKIIYSKEHLDYINIHADSFETNIRDEILNSLAAHKLCI